VALGLLSRLYPLGLRLFDKNLGDALYAVAAYLGLSLLWPRWPVARRAVAALAFCFAVECFQLTGLPARYARVPPVRWLLGTTFAPEDLVCYAVGVAAIALLDAWLLRAHNSPDPQARRELS